MEDDPSASVKALVDSIKPLQQLLENAVLSKPLSESFSELQTMQQANSSVTLAYAIYDLLWIYLKLQGVDPQQHAVFQELQRVRKYMATAKDIEEPEKRTTRVDKDVAARFIKHAIASGNAKVDPHAASAEEPSIPVASTSAPDIGKHTRLSALSKPSIADASSDEEDLKVHTNASTPAASSRAASPQVDSTESSKKKKKRKAKTDPLSGYDGKTEKKKKKSKKVKPAEAGNV